MTLIVNIRSVWVPFRIRGHNEEIENVCNDIPRFLHPEECKDFMQLNKDRLNFKLQFQERFEEEFKQEYARGVGMEASPPWQFGPAYGPEVPMKRRSLRDYD